MRKLIALSLTSAALAAVAAPLVSDVSLSQAGGTVTIGYTISEDPGIVTVDIQTNVSADVWVSIGGEHLTYLDGDVNRRVGIGAHEITWKPRLALPYDRISKEMRAVVTAWSLSAPPDYMVACLTNANDVAFYADAASVPKGVTDDMYKTDYLVMRKCPAANVAWRMGSPVTENKRATDGSETPHIVTLSDDFYICIYPITQRQYEILMLANGAAANVARPSTYGLDSDYAMRLVEHVSYDALRGTVDAGYNWPATGHEVKPDGFISYLRAQTGLSAIDLPTEAQWEFACRAGCGAALYNGRELPAQWDDATPISEFDMLNELGRHRGNGGWIGGLGGSAPDRADATADVATPIVGSYLPNAWGIYDMLGGAREWCLDWFRTDLTGVNPETGPAEGEDRPIRGGGWAYGPHNCRCADRGHAPSASGWPQIGFRLACPAVIQ